MFKKLLSLIPTAGKPKEQIKKEMIEQLENKGIKVKKEAELTPEQLRQEMEQNVEREQQEMGGPLQFATSGSNLGPWNKKAKKILYFDDDTFLRNMYEVKIKNAGFNFVGFEHPLVMGDPLELVLKEKPDLIITSLTMPKMNGETLIEKLQSDSRTKIYPIFCLTNHSEKSEILRIKSLGVIDYFVKAEIVPSEVCDAAQSFFKDRENYKKNIDKLIDLKRYEKF
jgi:two-component system chemotaxis response regulator CheY